MLELYFYFLQIVLKIHTFGKRDEEESFGDDFSESNFAYSDLIFTSPLRIL